jgi:hypothetical protein
MGGADGVRTPRPMMTARGSHGGILPRLCDPAVLVPPPVSRCCHYGSRHSTKGTEWPARDLTSTQAGRWDVPRGHVHVCLSKSWFLVMQNGPRTVPRNRQIPHACGIRLTDTWSADKRVHIRESDPSGGCDGVHGPVVPGALIGRPGRRLPSWRPGCPGAHSSSSQTGGIGQEVEEDAPCRLEGWLSSGEVR